MKWKTENSDKAGSIQQILDSIKSREDYPAPLSYLTDSMNEFWKIGREVLIPGISVKSLEYGPASEFLGEILSQLGPYLHKYVFLEDRNPPNDEHGIHFAKIYSGREIDFIHIVRLNFKFSSDSGTIIKIGNPQTYPSYKTDRIFYKSRLIPVEKGGVESEFKIVRLSESQRTETDDRLFTSVMFDETGEIKRSVEYSERLGADYFGIPANIYQAICSDYFTACLNLPYPKDEIVKAALEIFEPVFIFLFSNYGDGRFSSYIEDSGFYDTSDELVRFSNHFEERVRVFFTSYRLETDDELVLQGLRLIRFELSNG